MRTARTRTTAMTIAAVAGLTAGLAVPAASASPITDFINSISTGSAAPGTGAPIKGAQEEVFGITWKFDRPISRGADSIGIVGIEGSCVKDVEPVSRTVEPLTQTQEVVFHMTPANTSPPILLPFSPCDVAPSFATWDIYTTTGRATDKTRVKFSRSRGNNSLEWQQSTFSGSDGTVFINRVATGLVLTVHN